MLFHFYRLLQSCNDDSLNVALPMRMLEVFSSENTYLPVLQDASYVVSVIEQILHYMIHNGKQRVRLVGGVHDLPASRGSCFCRRVAAAPSTHAQPHSENVGPCWLSVLTFFDLEMRKDSICFQKLPQAPEPRVCVLTGSRYSS